MSKLKSILLVEDDARDLELELAALAKTGLGEEIAVARDGDEALDFLYCRGAFTNREDMNPALVLLDLKLTRVDGIQVLAQLRADERLRLVPVVMLTSSQQERDVSECYRRGANAYVVKPMDSERFIEAVRQIGAFWAVTNQPPPGSRRT
jgi:CheY-like chemotaxis protein